MGIVVYNNITCMLIERFFNFNEKMWNGLHEGSYIKIRGEQFQIVKLIYNFDIEALEIYVQ